ncbi:dethiobiotin synthase [Ancylobacter sp. FA202]|uniref:dethiobiotin synthase n=1 Tax=Ancylobacter sp. FA202 TaxID=1111106 RepID=UPI000378FA59|nr:dethiobiotin synthase [Ancylobacter sp. FA202]
MTQALVVTGTDTGVGKTVVAAGLAGLLGAAYWKPVQAGLDGETDSETARRLGGLDASRVLAEAYRLRTPASPHHAAALDGMTIDLDRLAIPQCTDTLVIEGAGGLMVPLTGTRTFLDLFARWQVPVVLCARTRLGTINHTLLSLEALRRCDVPVLGVVFVGDAAPESEAIIAALGAVCVLGRLPWLEPLTPGRLRAEMKPISARIAQAMRAC